MPTHDMVINNAVGATVRSDINSALAALVANSSNATEPATMYAYMPWFDTTTNILKMRNAANTAWLGYPIAGITSVASATTINIFGAAGATIDLTGTTTITGLTACTAAQVGSKKTVIPSNSAGVSFTASANMKVDGATSGTFLMPQNAIIEILATSTTTFNVRTVYATGTWTPAFALAVPGTSSFGTYSVQDGSWVKIGKLITASFNLTNGVFSLGTGSGALTVTGLPFATNSSFYSSGSVGYANNFVTNAPENLFASPGTTVCSLMYRVAGNNTNITAANCTTAMVVFGVLVYEV